MPMASLLINRRFWTYDAFTTAIPANSTRLLEIRDVMNRGLQVCREEETTRRRTTYSRLVGYQRTVLWYRLRCVARIIISDILVTPLVNGRVMSADCSYMLFITTSRWLLSGAFCWSRDCYVTTSRRRQRTHPMRRQWLDKLIVRGIVVGHEQGRPARSARVTWC